MSPFWPGLGFLVCVVAIFLAVKKYFKEFKKEHWRSRLAVLILVLYIFGLVGSLFFLALPIFPVGDWQLMMGMAILIAVGAISAFRESKRMKIAESSSTK